MFERYETQAEQKSGISFFGAVTIICFRLVFASLAMGSNLGNCRLSQIIYFVLLSFNLSSTAGVENAVNSGT